MQGWAACQSRQSVCLHRRDRLDASSSPTSSLPTVIHTIPSQRRRGSVFSWDPHSINTVYRNTTTHIYLRSRSRAGRWVSKVPLVVPIPCHAGVAWRGVLTVVEKELLNEVDVGEDHTAAAVALELELVERVTGRWVSVSAWRPCRALGGGRSEVWTAPQLLTAIKAKAAVQGAGVMRNLSSSLLWRDRLRHTRRFVTCPKPTTSSPQPLPKGQGRMHTLYALLAHHGP